MTDIHPTQIVNTTRNSNTTLQSSTLQSAKSLSKSYSFQSLRTVKGNVIVDVNSGESNFTVLNMYDGSPLKLNFGDIILGIVISNATFAQSITEATEFFDPTYNKYPQPWASSGSMIFYLCQLPTFNPGVKTPGLSNNDAYIHPLLISYSWTPNMKGNPIPLNISFDNSNTGPLYNANFPPNSQNIPLVYENSVDSNYQWITCNCTNLGMSGGVAGINITLLILNPLTVE